MPRRLKTRPPSRPRRRPLEEQKPTLPKRALALVSGAIPDREKLQAIVTAPVHYVEDGYSWVARRFGN